MCLLNNTSVILKIMWFSVRMYLYNGNIKIYKVPSYAHSATIGCVIGLINRWNDQDLEYGTDATMILGQNTAREPDSRVWQSRSDSPAAGLDQGADDNANEYLFINDY